jgi:hypothetical protein
MSYQRRCICGASLKPQKRGRKPLYCGQGCRRKVEFVRRRLALRLEWAQDAAGKPWAEEYLAEAEEIQAELGALEIGAKR